MIRRSRALAFGLATAALATCVALAAGGCGSTYRPDATAAPDGSADAPSTPDAGPADGGQDASTCTAALQTDPRNCGRCGHDCLGGPCSAGRCGALELASVSSAPFRRIVSYGSSLLVSTRVSKSADVGGIWRIPKAGGAAEPLVTLQYAEGIALLGDTLFFAVDDVAASGGGTGGLYSCPAMATAPCTPTLIAAATSPAAVTIDGGRVFYNDATAGKGLMVYAPPAAPTIYRAGNGAFAFTDNVYVDGASVFLTTTAFAFPQQNASLFQEPPDGGDPTTVFTYATANASSGRLVGTPTALYFSAYDLKTTTGGVLHRTSRNGGPDCDLGGSGNARPFGIHLDDTQVYWVNQGVGADLPYTGSTVVSCPLAGCCTTPVVLWTGEGQLAAITGDADALYVAGTESGSVWKLAKP